MATTTVPQIENFTVYEAATFRTVVLWETGEPLAPVNLTGFTARLQLKKKSDGVVALTLTEGAGLTLGGSAGTIQIEITAAQSESLSPEPHDYDLLLTAPSTEKSRPIMGTITVSARVTSPT